MGHIFISYSHKDSSYVHKLAEALEKEGFEVWIDDRIHYGSEWPKVVTRNLDASDGVVVVLSNNSYESDMVQNEVARAREKKKPIFPLLLDGENWLIVQTKQYVDVRDGLIPTEKFYKRLENITPRKKGEREATEKAALDKAEKARLEAEEKEKQKVEREASERAARERAMRESAEKVIQEKAKREANEKAKREAAKKIAEEISAHEKTEREAAEEAKRETEERRAARITELKETLFNFSTSVKSTLLKALPFLRTVSLSGIIVLLFWASIWIAPKIISPLSTPTGTATQRPVATVISENTPIVPTKTTTPSSIPTATTVTSFSPTPLPEPIAVSVTIEANGVAQKCREAPSQESKALYTIPAGKQLLSYGRDQSGQWLYVNRGDSDRYCWISTDGIKYEEDQIAKLPLGLYFSNEAEMNLVPRGTFIMGDTGNMDGDFDEKPAHSVYLDSYYIDKYEVTNQDFVVFLNDNYGRVTRSSTYYLIDGQEAFSLLCDVAYNPNSQNQCSLWRDKISDDLTNKQFVAKPTDKDDPVVMITWYGALEYCKWRSDETLAVILPTEAQWEKAARGTQEILYPWGNEKNCKYANYKGCTGNASPVGKYISGISPYGIYDMAGNVWEWVSDWYDGNYYNSLPTNISVNPLGPFDGETKVFRGGSWYYDAASARTTQRGSSFGDLNTYSSLTIGFRCSSMP